MLTKTKPARSEAYRRWVASLPCLACGIEGYSQAAHSNQSKHGKGLGMKASDRFVFPLCCVRPGHIGCHKMLDLRLGGISKAERADLEDSYIERTHARAQRDGVRIPE